MADEFRKCKQCGKLFDFHPSTPHEICVCCREPRSPGELTPEAGLERMRALNRKLKAKGSSLRESIHSDDE